MQLIQQAKDMITADFPVSGRKVVFNPLRCRCFILNQTAGEIWNYFKTPKTPELIIEYISKKYGINHGRSRRDLYRLIRALEENGLIKRNGRK